MSSESRFVLSMSSDEQSALRQWAQSESLVVPPFPQCCGQLRALARGSSEGDAELRDVSTAELRRASVQAAVKAMRDYCAEQQCEEAVRRGQLLLKRWCYAMYCGLLVALLEGLAVQRFSDVLVMSGYSSSPTATYARFRATAIMVFGWASSSLLDEQSEATQAVAVVRMMHEFARRRCIREWPKSDVDVGVPVSQYDQGLTLTAFSAACLQFFRVDCGGSLTAQDVRDWEHFWACVGCGLGLKKEFNVCYGAVGRCEAVFREMQAMSPHVVAVSPKNSLTLLRSCLAGFELHTPRSASHYYGLVQASSLRSGVEWGASVAPRISDSQQKASIENAARAVRFPFVNLLFWLLLRAITRWPKMAVLDLYFVACLPLWLRF